MLQSPIKTPTGTSILRKISFFIQQGIISYQNDISQKTVRLRDLVVRLWKKLKNCATHSRIMRSRVCRSVCAHKKAIGLSSIQAREEYTQMLMLVLSAPWRFKLKMGFSLTVLQDGESCDITGEYLESGSTNELKLIVKDYWTLLRTVCLISNA